MSGYRDRSSFDPYAGGDTGPPMRPYNWVQWTGVAFVVGGAALSVFYLLGQFGVVPKILRNVLPASTMVLLGVTLINSRRQPHQQLSEETKRQRMLIIAVAFAICILAIGAALYFKGAGS
jgi:hypothetical protein